MARNDDEQPFWRHFEESFLIRWLYKQGNSWKMTMGEVAVAELIKAVAAKLIKRYPRRQRSAIEIVWKIADLRDDYRVYLEFISTSGVRLDGKRPTIYSWHTYLQNVGPRGPRRFRKCRRYGIKSWRKQTFLFDGGYLGVVDLDIVAYYMQNR